jgi:hypothetical protein
MDLSAAAWRISSHSGTNGACIEVATLGGAHQAHALGLAGREGLATAPPAVAVRDSKDRSGPALTFAAQDWLAFTASLKATG